MELKLDPLNFFKNGSYIKERLFINFNKLINNQKFLPES